MEEERQTEITEWNEDGHEDGHDNRTKSGVKWTWKSPTKQSNQIGTVRSKKRQVDDCKRKEPETRRWQGMDRWQAEDGRGGSQHLFCFCFSFFFFLSFWQRAAVC
jgi:hypothetical protein